jgi:hypothetical protein
MNDDQMPPSVAATVPAAELQVSASFRATARELEELRVEIDELETRVAQREQALAVVRAGLRTFEIQYRSALGTLFAELDLLEADIAEAIADMSPHNPDLREKARQARARAEASARALDEDAPCAHDGTPYSPSESLKRLYRRVAFMMHPDRCSDAVEADIRHELMVEANRAYSTGNHEALESLLTGVAPENGDGASIDVTWLRLRADRARQRLAEIAREMEEAEKSDLFRIWQSAEEGTLQGRDITAEKRASLDRAIARARARVEVLRLMKSAEC